MKKLLLAAMFISTAVDAGTAVLFIDGSIPNSRTVSIHVDTVPNCIKVYRNSLNDILQSRNNPWGYSQMAVYCYDDGGDVTYQNTCTIERAFNGDIVKLKCNIPVNLTVGG